jgi:hypothetical protein
VTPAKEGIFPLDERWHLTQREYSPTLGRELVWLSGVLPYEQASEVCQRWGQLRVPTTTLWEHTQAAGQRLVEYVEHEREHSQVERTQWNHRDYDPRACKAVCMDGGMVYVRGEGWKELKAGVIGDIEQARVQTTTRPDDQSHRLRHLRYVGVVGDGHAFSRAMWILALQHGVPYAGRSAVIADGASWIWRVAADLFPVSTQIVDWYHAKDHLAQAALAVHPDDLDAAHRWLNQQATLLYQGEIWKLLLAFRRAGLDDSHARYFLSHQRRMQYQTFRAEGFVIGSGSVESGIKQYKARLTGAGMRWSQVGVNRMVVIRSAILSGTFNDLWAAA